MLPGLERLVQALDNAVAGRSPAHAYAAVRGALPLLVADPQVRLPAHADRPLPERYARHVLYRSPAHGYCVVAMAWAPGQGTELHDHAGLWCAEAVWTGCLDVTPAILLGRDDDGCCRFRLEPAVRLQQGDSDGLDASRQYHRVRNPDAQSVAVSLHVYQAEPEHCQVFIPAGDGRYRPQQRQLASD